MDSHCAVVPEICMWVANNRFSKPGVITKQMQSVKQHRSKAKINGKISAVISSDMLDNASSTQRSDSVSSCDNVTLFFLQDDYVSSLQPCHQCHQRRRIHHCQQHHRSEMSAVFQGRESKTEAQTIYQRERHGEVGQIFHAMVFQPWHLSWSCMVPFVLLLWSPGLGRLGFHDKGHICLWAGCGGPWVCGIR